MLPLKTLNIYESKLRMSIRTGLYAASTLLATFVTGYVLYALLTDQLYLLDIGWLLLAINPYYWAATGKTVIQITILIKIRAFSKFGLD